MTKKDEIVGQEQEQEQEQEQDQTVKEAPLTEEQILLKEALDAGKFDELLELELISDKLKMLITVYTSLLGVLGAEAPATINALANLESYTPDKIKKPKKEKEQKFNEGKAVRAIFNNEELSDEDKLAAIKELQGDERISEQLGIAITTYVTLLGIDGIPEQAVISAYDTLVNWGKKGKSKSTTGERNPGVKQEAYGIVVDGDESIVYSNRTNAVRALGYDKSTFIGDSKISTEYKAWQHITKGLHSPEGYAEYEGHTFKRVSASLITA